MIQHKKDIEAVKRNGYALGHVKEQTPTLMTYLRLIT